VALKSLKPSRIKPEAKEISPFVLFFVRPGFNAVALKRVYSKKAEKSSAATL
jgi:hypothetical protein